MTEKKQIYKCAVCGQVIEVLEPGAGELVCCGKPMQNQTPNTEDASLEKHVPQIRKDGDGTVVSVGSAPHPMIPAHYIGWVELLLPCGKSIRCFLTPGDLPEVRFPVPYDEKMHARAWCNIHGLWRK